MNFQLLIFVLAATFVTANEQYSDVMEKYGKECMKNEETIKELIKDVRDGKRNFCSHEHLKEFLNCILEEKMKIFKNGKIDEHYCEKDSGINKEAFKICVQEIKSPEVDDKDKCCKFAECCMQRNC